MLLISIADSLSVLQSEICVLRSPLPAALLKCAELYEQTQPFYQMLLHGIDTDLPFSFCWRNAAEQMRLLTEETRRSLIALGGQIGRYDLQAQETAFSVCIAALRERTAQTSLKLRESEKLSVGVGAACGLLLVIACY